MKINHIVLYVILIHMLTYSYIWYRYVFHLSLFSTFDILAIDFRMLDNENTVTVLFHIPLLSNVLSETFRSTETVFSC